jgi:hypothetical protein
MDAGKKGKTLWEMLVERLHKGGNGAGIPFFNPLDLRIGAAQNVAHANGPQFEGFDFAVQEIREYTRHIDSQEFRFSDYVLRGVSTKSFEAKDAMIARIRVVPNQAGANDSLLLRV